MANLTHTLQTIVTVSIFTPAKSFEKKVTLGELGLSESQAANDYLTDTLNDVLIDYVYDKIDCKWSMPCDLSKATLSTPIDFIMTFEGEEVLRKRSVLGDIFTRGNPAKLPPAQFDDIIEQMRLTDFRNDNVSYEFNLPELKAA